MHDTFLTEPIPTEFEQTLRQAFELCRDAQLKGQIYNLALAKLHLAQSPLVLDSLLAGSRLTDEAKSWGVRAVLHWAVEKLRPEGKYNPAEYRARAYIMLRALYFQGETVREVADNLLHIAEQTLYDSRPAAFAAVAAILLSEIETPSDVRGRKRAYFTLRYENFTALEQCILRLVAAFRQLPVALVEQLLRQPFTVAFESTLLASLSHLIASHFLLCNEEQTVLWIHPEARSYLLHLFTTTERRRWHKDAAQYYQAEKDYLAAALNFKQADEYAEAAEMVIKRHREIIANRQREELYAFLRQFRPAEVQTNIWAQLKIIQGGIAEDLQDLETAIAEYGKALAASDLEIKAQAYYHRGRALKSINLDEALGNYAEGLDLLESFANPTPALRRWLAKIHLSRAWLYFEDRQARAQAEPDLTRAEQLADLADRELWADLHNAWGEFYGRIKERSSQEQAIYHFTRALAAAEETQNLDQILKLKHNLGQIYVEIGQYQQAKGYLISAEALANQAGNRKLAAQSNKVIGACCFWDLIFDGKCSNRAGFYSNTGFFKPLSTILGHFWGIIGSNRAFVR